MLTDPEDDETEHFVDVPDVESCPEDAGSEEEASASRPALTAAQSTSAPPTSKYDGRKRDPRYCHAEITCLWELVSVLALAIAPQIRNSETHAVMTPSGSFLATLPPFRVIACDAVARGPGDHDNSRSVTEHALAFPGSVRVSQPEEADDQGQ